MEKIREFFRTHWKWAVPGLVIALTLSGLLIANGTGLLGPGTPDETEIVVPPPPPKVAEPDVTVDPIEKPDPEPEPVPAPELNIKSTKTMKYSKVWNPPDDGQYFWQVVDPKMGYPASGGTDYVLAHACESKKCAGDGIRGLETGDTLKYKGGVYRIDDKISIMKDELPTLEIWEHHKDRLVVITCIIETTWWASDKNDVIVATKVG